MIHDGNKYLGHNLWDFQTSGHPQLDITIPSNVNLTFLATESSNDIVNIKNHLEEYKKINKHSKIPLNYNKMLMFYPLYHGPSKHFMVPFNHVPCYLPPGSHKKNTQYYSFQ